jgi:hypothetical protein
MQREKCRRRVMKEEEGEKGERMDVKRGTRETKMDNEA